MKKLFLIPLLLVAVNLSAQVVMSMPDLGNLNPSDSSNVAVPDTNSIKPVVPVLDEAVVTDIKGAKDVISGVVKPTDVDDQGMTPLMYAAKENQIRTVVILISRGAPINTKSKEGKTALDYAIESESKVVVSYLISKGAVSTKPSKVEGSK